MLRILLIVPHATDINLIPEIRELSSQHSVSVLNGNVTANDVYQAAKQEFDIIHLGGHDREEGFKLSDTENLTATDIAQICRMAHCMVLYINTCNMGPVAGSVSRRGGYPNPTPRYIIYSQQKLKDSEAWQGPLTFYYELQHQKSQHIQERAIVNAFQTADADGIRYNMLVSPTFLEQLLLELEQLRRQYHNVELTTKQLNIIAAAIATITLGIIALFLLLT